MTAAPLTTGYVIQVVDALECRTGSCSPPSINVRLPRGIRDARELDDPAPRASLPKVRSLVCDTSTRRRDAPFASGNRIGLRATGERVAHGGSSYGHPPQVISIECRRFDQMSFDVALARIAQLQSLFAAPAAAAPAPPPLPRLRLRPRSPRRCRTPGRPRWPPPPPRSSPRPRQGRRSSTSSARRSASRSSRRAPTTRRASRSTARRPPVPGSVRGARTSRRGPLARRACRSVTTARASVAWTTCTRGRRSPARRSRTRAPTSSRSRAT